MDTMTGVSADCPRGARPDGDAAMRDMLTRGVIPCCAVIELFVGAVHWSCALCGGPHATRLFLVSVAPAPMGWLAMLQVPRTKLVLLGASFALTWHYEKALL